MPVEAPSTGHDAPGRIGPAVAGRAKGAPLDDPVPGRPDPRELGAVEPIADTAASLFYGRLFELDPAIERLFRRTDMAAQRKDLMQTLTVVVKSSTGSTRSCRPSRRSAADTPATGSARSTTRRSARPCCGRSSKVSGRVHPGVREAWTEAYGTLASVMIDAAKPTRTMPRPPPDPGPTSPRRSLRCRFNVPRQLLEAASPTLERLRSGHEYLEEAPAHRHAVAGAVLSACSPAPGSSPSLPAVSLPAVSIDPSRPRDAVITALDQLEPRSTPTRRRPA